jgi:hypothetical protein
MGCFLGTGGEIQICGKTHGEMNQAPFTFYWRQKITDINSAIENFIWFMKNTDTTMIPIQKF